MKGPEKLRYFELLFLGSPKKAHVILHVKANLCVTKWAALSVVVVVPSSS